MTDIERARAKRDAAEIARLVERQDREFAATADAYERHVQAVAAEWLEVIRRHAAEQVATLAPVMTRDGWQPMNHDWPCPSNGCERAGTGDATVEPCGPNCTARPQ